RDGRLRHPTFRGLREDKDAAEIDLPTDIAVEDAMDASLEAVPARASGGAGRRRVPGEAEVAGIRITQPERVMFPEQGVTKLDLAQYYEDIEHWVLPHMANRPLTLVRCPEGRHGECFYQK